MDGSVSAMRSRQALATASAETSPPGEARADFGKGGLDQIRHGTLLDDAGHDEELPVGFRGVGENVRMHVFLDRLVRPGRAWSAPQGLYSGSTALVSTSARISIYAMMSAHCSPNLASVPSSGARRASLARCAHAIRGEHGGEPFRLEVGKKKN